MWSCIKKDHRTYLGMWTVSVDFKKNIEVMETRIESSIFVKQINGG